MSFGTRLPVEAPLVVGSDYSRWPMPGQLSMDTVAAGERSTFTPNPDTKES